MLVEKLIHQTKLDKKTEYPKYSIPNILAEPRKVKYTGKKENQAPTWGELGFPLPE
jgi:hypothetical protein